MHSGKLEACDYHGALKRGMLLAAKDKKGLSLMRPESPKKWCICWMKIESLLRITGGVLLNTPSVNTISDIKISPAKILSKDLFIDINNSEDEISEAIKMVLIV